jgi:hypothetical protein
MPTIPSSVKPRHIVSKKVLVVNGDLTIAQFGPVNSIVAENIAGAALSMGKLGATIVDINDEDRQAIAEGRPLGFETAKPALEVASA